MQRSDEVRGEEEEEEDEAGPKQAVLLSQRHVYNRHCLALVLRYTTQHSTLTHTHSHSTRGEDIKVVVVVVVVMLIWGREREEECRRKCRRSGEEEVKS